MLRKLIYSAAALLLSAAVVAAQGDTCSAFVETALKAAKEACPSYSRYNVCYAYDSVQTEVKPDPAPVPFDQVGHQADVRLFTSLQTSALDEEAGMWGLALFTIPYYPVSHDDLILTMALYGEASLDLKLPAILAVRQDAGTSVNVRSEPNINARIVGTLKPGIELPALDRLADNSWIRIALLDEFDERGWVKTDLVLMDGDIKLLPVRDTPLPYQRPLTLHNGSGTVCGGLPAGGVVLQSASGTEEFNLDFSTPIVIAPDSTVSVRIIEQTQMGQSISVGRYIAYYVLKGSIAVRQSDYYTTWPSTSEGLVAYVPLASDGGPLPDQAFVQPYIEDDVAGMTPLLSLLPVPITPAVPADIPVLLLTPTPMPTETPTPTATLEPDLTALGLIDGKWLFTLTDLDETCEGIRDLLPFVDDTLTLTAHVIKEGETFEVDFMGSQSTWTFNSDSDQMILEGMTTSLPLGLVGYMNEYHILRPYGDLLIHFTSSTTVTLKMNRSEQTQEVLEDCQRVNHPILTMSGIKQ